MAGRKKGTPKTGGRKKNTPNKVTADIKAIAQPYGAKAVAVLASIMDDAMAPHAARVSAADKLLDRGFGKAKQSIDHSSEDGSMRPPSLADFYAEHGIKSERPSDA